jgi:hypothetical protein
MKKIPLTQGKFAIVDDEDYKFLSRFSWQTGGSDNDNVSTNFKLKSGRWVRIPMNRFLYKPEIQMLPTYKNKDPFDNRKKNIILVSQSVHNGTNVKMYQNLMRKGKMRRNPTSIYKGVSKRSDPRYKSKTWIGCIQFKGVVYTKTFDTEKQAGLWYNKQSRRLFGRLSYQNKIE